MELTRKGLNRMAFLILLTVMVALVGLSGTLGLMPAVNLFVGWSIVLLFCCDQLLRERDAAAAKRDANRTLALAGLEEMLRIADRLAELAKWADPATTSNWHIQSARKDVVRKFVHTAAGLGVTPEELAILLDRPLCHIDPLVLRDEIDEMTARAGWPTPDPAWKIDLMTFVRRGSSWPAAEITGFETSLRAYHHR